MPSLLVLAPVVIVAMIVQFAISASWSLPWFRLGLPLYRRPLPSLSSHNTAEIANAIRSTRRVSLAFRQLSAEEIGLRANLAFGFTGVQARISNSGVPHFIANLGWPSVVAYAFFLATVWTMPGGSIGSNLFASLIVVAVPSIDIVLMLRALERLEWGMRGA